MKSINRGIPEPSNTTAAVTLQDSSGNARIMVEQDPKKPATDPYPPLTLLDPKYALKYGALVKGIEWDFGTGNGIVDYTRVFIDFHENRGVAVTRDTVEKFWVEAVKTRFKDDTRLRHYHLRQIRCALINDCWIHHVFDLNGFASLLIGNTSDTLKSEGLRVWRSKRVIGRQPKTAMLLHDTHDCMASISKTSFDITRTVYMPYLGLSTLKTIQYRNLAPRVRRGDGQPMDQALMHLVWRGVIFNLFYFESEDLKKAKLVEEDWQSVQLSANGVSSSPKRVRDGNDESVPKRKREEA